MSSPFIASNVNLISVNSPTEKVVNGNFSSDPSTNWNATSFSTDWNWTGSSALHYAGNTTTIFQTPSMSVVIGTRYYISYVIQNRSNGSIKVTLGGAPYKLLVSNV